MEDQVVTAELECTNLTMGLDRLCALGMLGRLGPVVARGLLYDWQIGSSAATREERHLNRKSSTVG